MPVVNGRFVPEWHEATPDDEEEEEEVVEIEVEDSGVKTHEWSAIVAKRRAKGLIERAVLWED